MPVSLSWFVEGRIIYAEVSGDISEADLIAAVDGAIQLAGSVSDQCIHTLMDVTDTKHLPPVNVLARELGRMNQHSPNREMTVIFGLNRILRYTLELLLKLVPLRYRAFESREHAEQFLIDLMERDRQIAAMQAQNKDETTE